MRKGQKVRILRDNTIGTIADCTFFKLNGQKHLRYQVVTSRNKLRCWYQAQELGSITESAQVTIRSETGDELYANIIRDFGKNEMNIKITGNPENIKIHKGLHLILLSCLLDGLGKK